MTEMAIPYGVSLEGLMDVIAAWHRAKGYNKPLKNIEVAERVASSAKLESRAKVVSNQSTFLIQIGLLEKVGKQNQLTVLGHTLARMTDYSLDSEFNEKMKEVLLQWKEGLPILEFLFYKTTENRDALVERIVTDAGKSMETTNASMGGDTLARLLEKVGITEVDNQNNINLNSEVILLFTEGKLSLYPTQIVAASREFGNNDITSLKVEIQITIEGNLESQVTQVLITKLKDMLENLQYGLIDDD